MIITFEWMRKDFMLRAALTMQLREAGWRSSFKCRITKSAVQQNYARLHTWRYE